MLILHLTRCRHLHMVGLLPALRLALVGLTLPAYSLGGNLWTEHLGV